jgi:hypothetical protein
VMNISMHKARHFFIADILTGETLWDIIKV